MAEPMNENERESIEDHFEAIAREQEDQRLADLDYEEAVAVCMSEAEDW